MRKKKFNYYLDLLRRGNHDGLRKIYYCYYKKMVVAAEKITLSYFTAKEVVSDFFEYVTENIGTLPNIANPVAWMKEQIESRAIESVRTQIGKITMETFPKHTEAQKELAQIVAQLTDEEKELVILHYGYGYSFKKVAKIVRLPVRDIKIIIESIFLKFQKKRE